MTLEEAFAKYDNNTKLKRPHFVISYSIDWLKGLKDWGNQESRDLGFIIPQFIITDANANDWELVE